MKTSQKLAVPDDIKFENKIRNGLGYQLFTSKPDGYIVSFYPDDKRIHVSYHPKDNAPIVTVIGNAHQSDLTSQDIRQAIFEHHNGYETPELDIGILADLLKESSG